MSADSLVTKLQVLFVDDETNVLNGLRRLLRSHRDRWELHFASSGAAAIEQMQSTSFDVIVSDMRMPEMDGAELLLAAKKHSPNALRCVLSGQADRDQIMRVIESAHQFASKPCDTQLLERVVARAQTTKEIIPNRLLHAQITAIHSLPIHPMNWNVLLEELVSKDSSIDKVADIVAADIALSAKVLQLVNSSFFGQPKTVICPKAATKLLGIELFVELAIRRRILRSHDGPWPKEFSIDSFTKESREVAQIAYEMVWNRTGDISKAQEAEQAGLFHGVGKLVTAEHFPESYTALASSINVESAKVLDASFVEIGCALLTMWGLPAAIIDAISTSSDPIDPDSPFTVNTAVQSAISILRNSKSSATKVTV